MFTRRRFNLSALGGVAATSLPAAELDKSALLRNLRTRHPRLILDDTAIERVRALIAKSPDAARWYAGIRASAEETLAAKPSEYEIADGLRLLPVSRRVEKRVEELAFVWLLDKDPRCRDRMWAELAAAAAFRDWNPRHFLDTAELTYSFAIAYDWLYHDWSPEQRRTLRDAIINKGLQPAMDVYRSASGWHRRDNNWNQVCNGGIGLGALAIADENPTLVRDILYEGIRSIPRAMSHYAPDGAGTEGATYWDYGTRFNVQFMAALETALGSNFGLSDVPGFGESGLYQIYMCGPGGESFDFEDCQPRRLSSYTHFWMARRYRRPEYSWFRYRELVNAGQRGNLYDLLWFDGSGREFDTARLPLDRYFREAEFVSVRSSWTDPNAFVCVMQAGNTNNFSGHRHLDLGTFILEALGERWIIDSGVDHETYLHHQNGIARQDFYRIRAEGHNLPVINPGKGPDQDPAAFARVKSYRMGPEGVTAVFDLTPAYAQSARQVERTLSTPGRKRAVITDRITALKPSEIWWFAHTTASVKLSPDGRRATLSQNGKTYPVTLLSPAVARFEVMDAAPLPTSPHPKPQADNEGRRKLAIHLSGVSETEIAVAFGEA